MAGGGSEEKMEVLHFIDIFATQVNDSPTCTQVQLAIIFSE